MSFTRKILTAHIQLTINSSQKPIELTGYPMQAVIENKALEGIAQLSLTVTNLPDHVLKQIATLAASRKQHFIEEAHIDLLAGDVNQMEMVFSGSIVRAEAKYLSNANVILRLEAAAVYVEQLGFVAPNSQRGVVNISNLMRALAQSIEFSFQNDGVEIQVNSPYLYGSVIHQLKYLANMARIGMAIENKCVFIWPNGGFRKSPNLVLSSSTGLLGHPSYASTGLNIECFFTSALVVGGKIEIDSPVAQANGAFYVQNVVHQLSANTKSSKWFSYAMVTDSPLYVSQKTG